MHALCLCLGWMLLTTTVVTPARQVGVTWHDFWARHSNVFRCSYFSKLIVTGSTHLMQMHVLCLPLGGMLLITKVVTPALRRRGLQCLQCCNAGVAWHEFWAGCSNSSDFLNFRNWVSPAMAGTHLMRMHAFYLALVRIRMITEIVTPARRNIWIRVDDSIIGFICKNHSGAKYDMVFSVHNKTRLHQ